MLAACDDGYFFRFVPGLVTSMAAAEVPALHLHLLDPSPDTLEALEEMRAEFPQIALTHTIDRCSAASGLTYRNIYFNVARFVVAPLLLDRGVDRLLIIDVDSVVHFSPWPMLDMFQAPLEAAFNFRDNARRPWHRVLANAVVLRRNPSKSSSVADMFARAALQILQLNPRYHIDQIVAFYVVCHHAKTREIVTNVPGALISLESANDAAIWTSKGPRKHSEPVARL